MPDIIGSTGVERFDLQSGSSRPRTPPESFRRVEVKPYNVAELVNELRIVEYLALVGLSPKVFQIRPTVDCDSPLSAAIDALTIAWYQSASAPTWPPPRPQPARR
jgi:hypothetical protein